VTWTGQRRMSIIEEGPEKHVRHGPTWQLLAAMRSTVSSQLHSELIKTSLVPDFAQLWPERFSNKTTEVRRGAGY